jgi:hypothetical protein
MRLPEYITYLGLGIEWIGIILGKLKSVGITAEI